MTRRTAGRSTTTTSRIEAACHVQCHGCACLLRNAPSVHLGRSQRRGNSQFCAPAKTAVAAHGALTQPATCGDRAAAQSQLSRCPRALATGRRMLLQGCRRIPVGHRLALASLLFLLCCVRCSAYVSLPPEVAGAVTQLGTSLAGVGAAAPAPQPQPAPGGGGNLQGNLDAALGLSGSNAGRGKGPSAKGASGRPAKRCRSLACCHPSDALWPLSLWRVALPTVGFLQLQSNLTDIDRLAVRAPVPESCPSLVLALTPSP